MKKYLRPDCWVDKKGSVNSHVADFYQFLSVTEAGLLFYVVMHEPTKFWKLDFSLAC